MKNMGIIIKKELIRFFTDYRLVISTLIIPGLMIFVLYSLIGTSITSSFSVPGDYKYAVCAVEMPQEINELLTQTCEITPITIDELSQKQAELKEENIDAIIVFPEDFKFDGQHNIKIYYTSMSNFSSYAYEVITLSLDAFEDQAANLFDVNAGDETFDLADQDMLNGKMMAMMLPMFLIMFLFSGCMAVGPESIAGEKERGTIATLLITPIKRWQLALGKIIPLSIIALLSGISSFLGTMLSFPAMMQGVGLDASIYVFSDYIWLLCVIFATVLVMISAISVISAYAKSIKEATTLLMPLMLVCIVIGMSAMFSTATTNPIFYLIPVFNSVQAMSAIFSLTLSPICALLTIISNVIYTGVLTFLLAKMFDNEKIMFN